MTRKITRMALLIALAMILSAIERLIPMPIPVPGVKIGLANLVVLAALYLLSWREALIISALRVLLSGFLFGSLSSILYALAGAMVSFLTMALLKKTGRFSLVGVSVAGGVSHNVAQILVAAAIVRTISLGAYLPVLILSGVLAGLFNGIIASLLVHRLGKILPL